jgi:hypothetical protein
MTVDLSVDEINAINAAVLSAQNLRGPMPMGWSTGFSYAGEPIQTRDTPDADECAKHCECSHQSAPVQAVDAEWKRTAKMMKIPPERFVWRG